MNNKKEMNVKKIYLKHENVVHEFITTSSPFVCEFCYTSDRCLKIKNGFSEEPIEILNMNNTQREFKYQSKNFYGKGYCTDVINIHIKIISSYSFSVLITRDSAFLDMPIDFHELTSSDVLTPKYIHENILKKLIETTRNIDCFSKLLREIKDEESHFYKNSNSFLDIY